MIKIDVPGWGNMELENIVLDLNGTIATDGKILPEVKQRMESLSEGVKIYVLTADTYGTANDEIRDMKAELVKIAGEDTQKGKCEFVKTLDLERTVAIGNGNSDLFKYVPVPLIPVMRGC